MTEESLFKTCELLHVTHRQPIACYRKDKTLLQIFCSYPNYEKVFSSILKKSISEEKSLVSGLVGLYGIIKISSLNMVLITGPFVNKKIDETVLDSLIHEYSLLSEEKEDLQKFLLSLPHHSLNRFLSFNTSSTRKRQRSLPTTRICLRNYRRKSKPSMLRTYRKKNSLITPIT